MFFHWQRTELVRVPWSQEEISRRMWIEGVGKAMQNLTNEAGGGTLVPVVVGPMGYQLLRGLSAVKDPVLVGFGLEAVKIVEQGPLKASLTYRVKVGENSEVSQKISIDAVHPYLLFETSVNWKESHKFLKVEFPVTVLSRQATYEIQFGHIQRPTHCNTSWEWAKFEVCAHRWIDLSEYDWGVALLNTSKYGYSVRGNIMCLSLLRSPKSPDPMADIGEHVFSYAIMPHTKSFQQTGVIQQAYQLNSPLHMFPTSHLAKPGASHYVTNAHRVLPLEMHESLSWFQVSDPAVVIDAVKKAEDRDDCLVVRLYEAFGSRVRVVLRSCLPINKAVLCNALEDMVELPGQKVK